MYGVLSVTAPIYLLIVAGFLATRFGLFERADMRVFGKYTINLALPALLFNALSQRQVGEILTPLFIAAYLGGSLIVMVAGIVWARRVAGKDLPLSAVIGMGMACPNSGFIGFPLVAQVFGPSTAGVALALAMFVENFFLIPIALAIADSGGGEGVQGSRLARWRVAMMHSLRTVVRNPLNHGLVLCIL
ncbi:MAG: AEC family transporter, partial [Ramlibacter sp.]